MLEGIGLKELLDFGVSGAAVLAVILGFLIPKPSHLREIRQLESQRDEWRALALRALGTGEVAVTALETIKDEAAKQ